MNGEISGDLAAAAGPGGAIAGSAPADARFLTILNTMPQAVWSALPDGYHDFYNNRWYEFTGAPHGSTDGEAWSGMFHPDDQARAWSRWRQSLATGEAYDIEYRLRHRSGEYRWTLGRALPIRGPDGEIERWFGTCTDIHDLKVAEEQRTLIARELSHRIKNIFAVISSLITLSVRNNAAARPFAQAIRARIDALAHAHNYVRPHSDESKRENEGQTVIELLGKVLAAYMDENQSRIVINGANAPVGVSAATSIALVVHELATNAIKYGALSKPAGQVLINCENASGTYSMVWSETGGPAIDGPPPHRGFGTVLSERSVTALPGSTIAHEWRASGLVVRIAIPTQQLER